MLVVTLVGLYTSRLVLYALGVADYGIYSVVGGLVAVASFLQWTLNGTIQRFLNISIGRQQEDELRRVFSSVVTIQIVLVIGVLLLAETAGLWFLNERMNIPEGRMEAANWVYQLSVAAFVIDMLSIPYDAAVIAHEKMSAFAGLSIARAAAGVIVAIVLLYVAQDRLMVYALLGFMVSIAFRYVYIAYCKQHFKECAFRRIDVSRDTMGRLARFAFWSQFGHMGFALHLKGMPLLVNLFFSVTVNAALSIAFMVHAQVRGFMGNFMTALKPQMVTCYATGDRQELHLLICRSSRIAFCLVLLMVVPLLSETPELLSLWLKEVPPYTVVFVRIILLTILADSFSMVMEIANAATGQVRAYGLWIMVIAVAHLSLTIVFFLMGYGPQYTLYLYLLAIIAEQIVRTWIVSRDTELGFLKFLKEVARYMLPTAAIAFVLPSLLRVTLCGGFGTMILIIVAGVTWTCLTVWLFALTGNERHSLLLEFRRKWVSGGWDDTKDEV